MSRARPHRDSRLPPISRSAICAVKADPGTNWPAICPDRTGGASRRMSGWIDVSIDESCIWPRGPSGLADAEFDSGRPRAPLEDATAANDKGDTATALAILRPLADQGNADAQYNLGVIYGEAQGVPRDFVEAGKWFAKAAAQGNASAQYNLGVMYFAGQGFAPDAAEAAKWFRKAAEQSDPAAGLISPSCSSEGQGVPRDAAEALRWRLKSAEQDSRPRKTIWGWPTRMATARRETMTRRPSGIARRPSAATRPRSSISRGYTTTAMASPITRRGPSTRFANPPSRDMRWRRRRSLAGISMVTAWPRTRPRLLDGIKRLRGRATRTLRTRLAGSMPKVAASGAMLSRPMHGSVWRYWRATNAQRLTGRLPRRILPPAEIASAEELARQMKAGK